MKIDSEIHLKIDSDIHSISSANRLLTFLPALLLLTLALPALLLSSCSKAKSDTAEISMLDSLISEQNHLEKVKLSRIDDLRRKRARAATTSERYTSNSLLFEEYSTFLSDSAMKYVDENLDIATQSGNREWEIRSKIDKSELLAATGLLAQSADVIASIDRSTIPDELLTDYYGQMIFLYSHLGNYNGGNGAGFYARERDYKDSIMQIIDRNHPEYLWYQGWGILGSDSSETELAETIAALKKKVDNSELKTRQDAKDAYILSKLYQEKGDKSNHKRYMAISAIADLKMMNAEISSLEDLAKIMFEEGDINHAYSYINYTLNKAIAFPNRVKAFGITQSLDKIYDAYQQQNMRQQRATHRYLILVCILAIVLAILITIVILQNLKLKRRRKELNESNLELHDKVAALSDAESRLNTANAELKNLNASLKQKNEELNEANYVKEEYIGYVFNICSSYISKLEDLKKNIHTKALAKKFNDIEAETSDYDMKKELKDFYHSFDTIFLHIYPNFVNDFNTLLQDDKKIYPKEGELLNTELRIYALVRLGITDSVKISDFLHCSPQTVYNNRFKVRNRAKISKKEFAESVRMLGKYQDRTS